MVLISNLRAPTRYLRRLSYDQVWGKLPFVSKSRPAEAVAGEIDIEIVRTAVDRLRSHGIVCFPGYFKDAAKKLREAYAAQAEDTAPANRYSRTYFGPTGSSLITDISLDETMLSIAAGYLRCQPYLRHGANVSILKPADTTDPRYGVPNGLQDWPWHIDTPNLLSFHILLNDTTENDTRMRYAVGSHRINRPASGIRTEEAIVGRNEIFECAGPAGTLYIFDNNGFHRPHAVAGSMRVTFEFYFTPGNQIFSMAQMRNIVEADAANGKRDLQYYGEGVFDDIEIPDHFSPIQREALGAIVAKTRSEEQNR